MGGGKREKETRGGWKIEVAASGEPENLVTVFGGGSKALSGGAEAQIGGEEGRNKAAEEETVKGA